jgi:hypothetical protein
VKILKRFEVAISNGNFLPTCVLEFSVAASQALTFYWHELVAAITLIWNICPSMRVFTCSFNTAVIHHIRIVKYVSGCPKVILDVGLVADVKFHFPGLHAHLTLILSIFFVGTFESQGICQYSSC